MVGTGVDRVQLA